MSRVTIYHLTTHVILLGAIASLLALVELFQPGRLRKGIEILQAKFSSGDLKEKDERLLEQLFGPDSSNPYIYSKRQIQPFLSELKAIRAGVGNTDFTDLVDEHSGVNFRENCVRMKPNLKKRKIMLKSLLWNRFDPPVLFMDRSAKLSPGLVSFIERYRLVEEGLETNEFGERVTVPYLKREKKVLVVGDSVAMGVGVGDEDTLASQLQSRDSNRQYINIGLSGSDTENNICLLKEAMKRHQGVEEIIYVVCENDFESMLGDSVDANELVSYVSASLKQISFPMDKLKVVYVPMIYAIPPQLEIGLGAERSSRMLQYLNLKTKLQNENIFWIDVSEIALNLVREENSVFSPYTMYADHVHLNRRGLELVSDKILQGKTKINSSAGDIHRHR